MKVPCGGFDLDESVFNVDKNSKQIKLNSPISYDYMPEGYPKKDGWSVEWDGNIDGKISAIGVPFYKFSDRVLTYEEFLSAMVVRYHDGESYSMMVSEAYPEQTQVADAVSSFICSSGAVQVLVVSEDNVEVEGNFFPTKGLYARVDVEPFKLIKETITPMSADFIPKNFNVVFKKESGSTQVNCNVTYNELRDWVERDAPVFAVFIDAADSKYNIYNITGINLLTDMLGFVYYISAGASKSFAYKSDGTIEFQTN